MINGTEYLTFDDVLIVPGYNDIPSRKDVDIRSSFSSITYEIPVCSSNMDTVTEDKMANAMLSLGGWPFVHRFCTIERNLEILRNILDKEKTAFSVGLNNYEIERADALVSSGCKIICVDVAHGHSKAVGKMIKHIKSKYGDNVLVVAGNVATYAGADYLASCGADAIKVGIGPGSVCQTRVVSGCGVPQLTAIMDCSRVDRTIIADGGIRYPGDVVKAIVAGADFVMLGGMLAGTVETPGEFVNGKKTFRGMASKEAQEDYMGHMSEWKTEEGIVKEVTNKGSVVDVIRHVVGGLRSGMTYCGSRTLKELRQKARMIKVTKASVEEGLPRKE
jgi:IMP dehydrogenase